MSSHPLPPHELLAALDRLGSRARGLSVTYGVGIVLLTLCGLLAIGALADWSLRLPGVPRLIGLIAALALLSWATWRYVIRPAKRRPGINDIAGRLEERFPQFDDRLRSGIGFLGTPPALPDEPLRRRTVEEAGALASEVRLQDVLQPRPALMTAGAALGAMAVLILVATLLGPLAGTILGRLIDPLNPNHQWPKRFAVAALELPQMHPAGRPLTVTAELVRGDPSRVKPVVYWRTGDGQVRQQLMTQRADGTFAATIDPRLADGNERGEVRVWVEAGDDTTRPWPVTVVARPVLISAIAQVTPPPYVTGGAGAASVREAELGSGPVVVGDGSTVALRMTFSKRLAGEDEPAITLLPVEGSEAPEVTWQLQSPGVATASFVARETTRFSVDAMGHDGFATDATTTFELVVRPDQQPSIQIDTPRRNESRTAEAVVPIELTAEDDFGFERVELVVSKLAPAGQSGWTTTVPLVGSDAVTMEETVGDDATAVRLRLQYPWDLSEVAEAAEEGGPLEPGDVLEFYAVAKDNFALDGNYHEAVESGRLRITIISQEELNRRVIRDLQTIKDEVAATKRRQDATARETAEWSEQTTTKPELDAADREAGDRLARQQSTVAAQTGRLGDRAAEVERVLEENNASAEDLKELAERITEQLERTAEGPMSSASAQIGRATQGQGQQERTDAAEQAEQDQQEASNRLDGVMKEMERIGSLRQSIDAVSELLQRQRELGEKTDAVMDRNVGRNPSEMSEEDRKALEDLANEQQDLAEETEQQVGRMSEQAEQMSGDDASSEAMKQAAQTAQQQNVAGNQRQASRQSRQNSRSEAQQSREQAEIGLQLVLNELQEAERAKLRELERQLADLAEQIERLIRRQAGHNADNLVLRGIDGETVAELLEIANLEADQAVAPTVSRLSAGQEQTERNTRDLSRPAEEVPEGSEMATLLSRASARMERAAVFIRQEDLLAAYEPPQQQALTALQEALDAAREQQRQVQEEIENQQREAVRERLVTLRDNQVREVNEPTTTIEAKRQAGELRRGDILQQLRPLSPRQQQLAGELESIAEALANVGGTAFVYAGNRTRQSMEDIADRLEQSDTSEATQVEQTQVVDALDAMIDALTLEMSEERFDRNDSGGGAGEGGQQQQQQGPQLPPEAELKLIRRLQEGVNDATTKLQNLKQQGDQAPPDLDDRLASTASEQGDLRSVLNQMLRNYSQGQSGFGPEPDPETLLPEETGDDPDDVERALDDRDLLDDLLGEGARMQPNGDEAADNNDAGAAEEGGEEDAMRQRGGGGTVVRQVGDYMARSRQRLDLTRDPGPVTQAIQRRILEGIDDLIEQARQQQQNQQQQASSSSSSSSRRPQPQPQPGQQQANASGENQPQAGQPGEQEGSEAAQGDRDGPAGQSGDLSSELEESLAEWGGLTPRQRQAILESRTDRPIDSYRELTEAFRRQLAEQSSAD